MKKLLYMTLLFSIATSVQANFKSRDYMHENHFISEWATQQIAEEKLLPYQNFVNYNLYVPPMYDLPENSTTGFPLLITLLGKGETARHKVPQHSEDLALLRKVGPAKIIYKNQWPEERPFIATTVQCYTSCGRQSPEIIMEAINLIKRDYRVDPSRIYLTGISKGAMAVNAFLLEYPTILAAAVPIAGSSNKGDYCALNNTAWWGLHNKKDTTIYPNGTIKTHNNLKKCAGRTADTRMTIYEEGRHDAWSKTYNLSAGNDIYAFMLENQRDDTIEESRPLVYGEDFVVEGENLANIENLFNDVTDQSSTDYYIGSYKKETSLTVRFFSEKSIETLSFFDGYGGSSNQFYQVYDPNLEHLGSAPSKGYYPIADIHNVDLDNKKLTFLTITFPKGTKLNELVITGK